MIGPDSASLIQLLQFGMLYVTVTEEPELSSLNPPVRYLFVDQQTLDQFVAGTDTLWQSVQ